MNTRSWILVGIVTIVAVAALAVLVGWRWGIVQFVPGKIIPSVSFAKFLNPKPSLDRPVHFPADFPQDAQVTWQNNVATAKASIEKDSANGPAWFDLAIYYKMVGDYDGAVQIWKYISVNYPTDGVSLHNLGEYYFHTAKDYPTAEKYYLQSIAVMPQLEANYTDLSDMYRYAYKQNTTAAADILKKGIADVPALEGIDLEIYLAGYYRDIGDIGNARAYFTQARAGAQAVHNATLVKQLDQQISALGK